MGRNIQKLRSYTKFYGSIPWCLFGRDNKAHWMTKKARKTYVIIFKNGSSMCKKNCSGQHWKNLTSFWTASFFNKACSTFLLSLSCAKQTAIESKAVTDQSWSSSKLKYTSIPPWALNCSLELRDACAISHNRGNAYCLSGESDMIKRIKCGMIPFSAACSCLLLLILHRLNSALRTFNEQKIIQNVSRIKINDIVLQFIYFER